MICCVTFVLLLNVCVGTTRLISTEEVQYLFQRALMEQLTHAENQTLHSLFSLWRRVNRRRSFSSNVRATVDCMVCKSAFSALFSTVRSGKLFNIARTLTRMCADLNYENYHVCKGAIELNLPIIAFIIQTTPEATPETFCSLALQYKYEQNRCTFEDPRFDWKVHLPDPPVDDRYGDITFRGRPRISKPYTYQRPLRVVLLTDAHLDPQYEPFGVVNCGEPICCRYGQKPSEDNTYKSVFRSKDDDDDDGNVEDAAEELLERSTIVGEHGDVLSFNLSEVSRRSDTVTVNRLVGWVPQTEVAGYWGDYRRCDTPLWAFDDLVENIARTHEGVDIIYYLGDSIDHGVWQTSSSLIQEINEYIVTKFKEEFGDDVPVLPAIGNHDSHPANQFAPPHMRGPLNTSWVYQTMAQQWGYYLNDDALTSFKLRGGYAQRIRPGLRVISVNNNVAFNHNWWLIYDPQDQKSQLEFLVDELYKAERAGDKVHLLLHIPAGSRELSPVWSREYARIVRRFASTIAAEFNGHTHGDSFKVFQDENGIPSNVAWSAGGITPYAENNMNYKIVEVDKTSFIPINIETYVYNLSEANQSPGVKPRWFKLYDMKTVYGLRNLHPKSVGTLVKSMASDRKDLLDFYVTVHSKGRKIEYENCDHDCRLKMLCDIVTTEPENVRTCHDIIYVYNSNTNARDKESGFMISLADVWTGLRDMFMG